MSEREPSASEASGASRAQPDEEELRAALEEQMRRITVQDVLFQTVATLVSLAGRRLGLAGDESAGEERDLEQARLAIEAVRALVPLLPADQVAPVKEALTQLQMYFARESQAPTAPPAPQEAGEKPRAAPAEEEAERAKARSRIWTPPGS